MFCKPCFANQHRVSSTKLSPTSWWAALPLATSTTSRRQSNLKASRVLFSKLLAPSPQKGMGVAPKKLKSTEGLVFATPRPIASKSMRGGPKANVSVRVFNLTPTSTYSTSPSPTFWSGGIGTGIFAFVFAIDCVTSLTPKLFTSSTWKNFSRAPAKRGWRGVHWTSNLPKGKSFA